MPEKQKETVLDYLRQMPIVELACKRAGIGRTTYYEWRKKYKAFQKDSDQAIADGEMLINDMGESQLVSLIKDKNFSAINLWLRVHHPRYANKVEITGSLNLEEEPLSEEQAEIVRAAQRLTSSDKDHDHKK